MELYSVILLIHIVGAIASLVYACYSLTSLLCSAADGFSLQTYILALAIGFQTLTGGLLALLSPEITALSLCDNLMLYISPLALIEFLLISRMIRFDTAISFARLAYPSLGSLAAFAFLVVAGV